MPIYIAKYSKSLKSSTVLPAWRALGCLNDASAPIVKRAYTGTMFNIAHLHDIPRGTRNAIYSRAGYIVYNGYLTSKGNIGSYVEDLEANTPGLVTDTLRKGTYVLNEAAKNIMGGNIIEGDAKVNAAKVDLTRSAVSGNANIQGGTFTDCKMTDSATVIGGTYERVTVKGETTLNVEGEATIKYSTFDGDTTLHYTANGEFEISGHNNPNSDRDLLAAFRFAASLFNCGTVHTFCLKSKHHNAGCKCGLYVPQAIRGSEVARDYMAMVNARSVDTERLEALEAEMNKEFTRRNVFSWSRELR